ncbi:MAG: hypothetical protein FJ403_19265 [Verrucomicrobia bacterium]|nr:hypothetical protein [Verrucomicrobiota bacterium]
MNKIVLALTFLGGIGVSFCSNAAVITVTTTNNASPASGEVSLLQAIKRAVDGDQIRFNISGAGPHYIPTPPAGYPLIKANNLTIDGYSQPGSSPNTNSILAPNNAKIRIVLDSRAGGRLVLANIPDIPLNGTDVPGYGDSESGMLSIYNATNVTVRGLGFLSKLAAGSAEDPAIYGVALIRNADGAHINGCWFGVDPDGKTVHGGKAGVTGFRHRLAGQDDEYPDHTVVGVKARSADAPAEFNVFVGQQISLGLEGEGFRIAGNFFNVFPDGVADFHTAGRDEYLANPAEGAMQIGRIGSNTVIGVDGDGDNDAHERNIIGGVRPRSLGGYSHTIEFYGGKRNNIVLAGNYIGVGINGTTRFTNGVPVVGGLQGAARIGSDFDGTSDSLEGNLIFNNYPTNVITPDVIVKDFLDGLGADAVISLRGNRLVNNFAPPASPLRDEGRFITSYYAKALVDVNAGIVPVLSTNTTLARLKGTVPVADTNAYPVTIVDLYLPDPEGLANKSAELKNGSIQGLTYLGSFVEGSTNDFNANPGEFDFDISRLGLAAGTSLTVTANYSQAPVGTHNAIVLTSPFANLMQTKAGPVAPPPLAISRSGNNITITWTGAAFALQSSAKVTGPWQNQPTTGNSLTAQATDTARFFRLASQ